jgi:hypothetical protein
MKYFKYLYTVFSLPSKLTIFTPDNLKHPYKDVTVPAVAGVSAVSSVSFGAGAHVAMLQIQSSAFLTSGSAIRIHICLGLHAIARLNSVGHVITLANRRIPQRRLYHENKVARHQKI